MSAYRSRGTALLSALVIVAIATTIAGALAVDTGLQIRRAEGAHARSTALAIAGGTEALAAQALAEQLKVPEESIHTGQRWAAPLGPLPLTAQSSVRAQLLDLQGRFNLNRLVDASGRANPEAIEAFERLLVALELEPQWAKQFADWIDSTANPGDRAINLPVTSTTELLALPEFGTERFIRLAPHVAALPRDTSVNLCTATGAVLDALANERQWRDEDEALARARARGCFPTREIFRTTLGTAGRFESLNRAVGLAESSRHFRLVTRVRVGSIEHTLYSLLRVETSVGATPRVRLLTRSTHE
ncbi:MAG: type II secretion system minor pseudopilin GspK [Steroidobacteraceae bacterium]